MSRALLAPLASLALGACVLPPPYQPSAPQPQAVPSSVGAPMAPATQVSPPAAAPAPAPAPSVPAPPAREYHLGPAAQSLVTQARQQAARGELPGASTTLDRAIRIEPQNPLLWIEVARVRLLENDARQAEACGRKALALASGDRVARAQAGHVLAEALRAQKRNQEAHDLEAAPWMN